MWRAQPDLKLGSRAWYFYPLLRPFSSSFEWTTACVRSRVLFPTLVSWDGGGGGGEGRVPCPWHPLHCNENPIYIFLFWELRGLSPNFHIYVSVNDLYIPRIGPHISGSRIGRAIEGIYKSLTERLIYSQDRSTYFRQQNRQSDRGNI